MWDIRFADCFTHLDVGDKELNRAIEAAQRVHAASLPR